MENLILSAKQALQSNTPMPFSIYSSVKEQHVFNVPIIKPLLIFILDGCKEIGKSNEINCPAGSFIFLSNAPSIEMRNIPETNEYFALLIEFDYSDFDCFKQKPRRTENYIQGEINPALENTLQQFIDWSAYAPEDMWKLRRQEILQLLYHQGYTQVSSVVELPAVSYKLHNIIMNDPSGDLSAQDLSSLLAMSESTLRRKLNAEGTSIQEIKDKAKLGYGLHLIQTTFEPVSQVAEQCGYISHSRFTDRFKHLFGITPTELRKTRMHE